MKLHPKELFAQPACHAWHSWEGPAAHHSVKHSLRPMRSPKLQAEGADEQGACKAFNTGMVGLALPALLGKGSDTTHIQHHDSA